MKSLSLIDAAALRAAREQAGVTQHELARLVGVAGGERVSVWERGLAAPSAKTLHAVAVVLNVPPTSLLMPLPNGPDLRWLRFAAGLNVTELAVAAQTSVSTVKRWEAHGSRRNLSTATIQAIASSLQVTEDVVVEALKR